MSVRSVYLVRGATLFSSKSCLSSLVFCSFTPVCSTCGCVFVVPFSQLHSPPLLHCALFFSLGQSLRCHHCKSSWEPDDQKSPWAMASLWTSKASPSFSFFLCISILHINNKFSIKIFMIISRSISSTSHRPQRQLLT